MDTDNQWSPADHLQCRDVQLMSSLPTRRRILTGAIGAGLAVSSRRAFAATALRLSFDRPLDGTMAPFMTAAANGLFRLRRL